MSPFRRESRAALLWAKEAHASWKFKYYAAVFLAYTGEDGAADALLDASGDPSDAVFRLYRASRRTGTARLVDLMAAKLSDDSWRVGRALARHFDEVKDGEGMLAATTDYISRFPHVHSLKILHATALLRTCKFAECGEYLQGVNLLPAEHGGNARDIWTKAWEGAARAALARGDVKAADEALRNYSLWPENIGAGKPYPEEK